MASSSATASSCQPQREPHSIAADAVTLEPGLLDRADRRLVVGRGLRDHALETEILETPLGCEPQRPRCYPAPSRLGKDRDRDRGLLSQLEVDQPERPIIGGIRDHERRAGPGAPLLLGPRHAFRLALGRHRLVLEPAPSLTIVRRRRDQRDVLGPPQPKDDLPVCDALADQCYRPRELCRRARRGTSCSTGTQPVATRSPPRSVTSNSTSTPAQRPCKRLSPANPAPEMGR